MPDERQQIFFWIGREELKTVLGPGLHKGTTDLLRPDPSALEPDPDNKKTRGPTQSKGKGRRGAERKKKRGRGSWSRAGE